MDLNYSWQVKTICAGFGRWKWSSSHCTMRLVKGTYCHCISHTLSLFCWVTSLAWGCTQSPRFSTLSWSPLSYIPVLVQVCCGQHCYKMTASFSGQIHDQGWWFIVMDSALSHGCYCVLTLLFHVYHFTDVLPSSCFRLIISFRSKSLLYSLSHAPTSAEKLISII